VTLADRAVRGSAGEGDLDAQAAFDACVEPERGLSALLSGEPLADVYCQDCEAPRPAASTAHQQHPHGFFTACSLLWSTLVGVADTVMLDGQDIGQAQRATSALLGVVLTEHGTTFDEWVVLNALATSAGRPERAWLVPTLAAALATGPAAVEAVIDRAEAAGLVGLVSAPGGDPAAIRVELTAVGRALHGLLREAINHMARELYSGIPQADLAAAHRVLVEVTLRADGWAALWDALPGQARRQPAGKSAR